MTNISFRNSAFLFKKVHKNSNLIHFLRNCILYAKVEADRQDDFIVSTKLRKNRGRIRLNLFRNSQRRHTQVGLQIVRRFFGLNVNLYLYVITMQLEAHEMYQVYD